MPTRIVIAGYYGEGNIGDDALLLGLLTGLGDADVEPTVLSGNPEYTRRNTGAKALPRRDLKAAANAIESSAALVFGGGGLLQDTTSLLSLKYYTHLIHTAKKQGKKVVLLAQGFGPVDSFFGKNMAAKALNACDVIAVRDEGSRAAIRALGVSRPVELTADLAWLAQPARTGDGGFQLGDMKSVAISARPWGKGKAIADLFGTFTQMLFRNNYVPVLVEMDRTMDTQVLDAIAKMHGGRCPDIRNVPSAADMLSRIGRMHAVVAMRLHAGVFAASSGIVPLMVAYDNKVSAFARTIDAPFTPLENLTAQRLWDLFRTLEDQREKMTEKLVEKREEQVALAKRNIDLLLSAL